MVLTEFAIFYTLLNTSSKTALQQYSNCCGLAFSTLYRLEITTTNLYISINILTPTNVCAHTFPSAKTYWCVTVWRTYLYLEWIKPDKYWIFLHISFFITRVPYHDTIKEKHDFALQKYFLFTQKRNSKSHFAPQLHIFSYIAKYM